ncbi:MAG TPA: ankyrin repeat domain-containing protein, partial [Pyrinomonadaceae bacterium]
RRPNLPAAVADVLTNTLSKERGGRPATAGAFACALRLAAEGERAIRREASAIYQKNRWLFLKTAARVHAPVISLALLLLLSAVLLPVMSPIISVIVFGLLWLVVLFLALYGNAATTAACTLIIEQVHGRGGASLADESPARSVRRESMRLMRAVASGALDAVRAVFSLRRGGWRAYFDSLLLIPVVISEKLRGRDALPQAKALGRHVRRLAADIRTPHLVAVAFSLLAYQVSLICWGIVLDGFSPWTPRPLLINNLIIMLLVMAVMFGLLIIMQVRTGIEHVVLYLRARAISGEPQSNAAEPHASGALMQSDANVMEQPRLPHGRAIVLATLFLVAASGWQFFKQAVITSSVEEGTVNLVKAFNASGVPVPVWSRWGRPDVGALMRWPTPIVELLIAKGADVNARVSLDRWWMPPYKTDVTSTPLMSALTVNSARSARVLLEHGADIHAQDSLGRTPLMVAAIYCPEAIDLLLQHGADINERTGKGTPLLNAARYRGIYDDEMERTQAGLNARDDALPLLLKRGANPFDLDEE